MYAESAAVAAGGQLALWSPLLALHACRLRRYLSDDCLRGYGAGAGERRRCDLCLAAFPSAWLLERHAALQHASLPGVARVTAAHAQSPYAHAACSLTDDKPFVCEQCGQSYRYRSAYAKHREQNHRARLPADKLFTCDVCGMQFRYLKSFKKHRLNHALERLHTKTGGAGGAVGSGGGVVAEARTSTGAASSSNEASGCEAEPEQDDTVDSYGAPLDADSESTPSEGLQAVSVSSVADSSESEAMRVPGGAFGFSAAESERQRERERRFACPFCGKCVRSKENLKLHVRKHTGERPFVCLFCGRAFGGKSDLTRHLRIHTGERPYHCEACGKCFARADYLSKHLTTHVHNAR